MDRRLKLVALLAGLACASPCLGQCGVQWVPDVGAIGISGATAFGQPPSVRAMTVFDDGTGPALYAGGAFTSIGGVVANCIAKWDGFAWSPLGSGLAGGLFWNSPAPFPDTFAATLQVFDDGSGSKLYVGGSFATAGGLAAPNIARWTGTSWEPVGAGCDNDVLALETANLGFANLLFAGGRFVTAGVSYVGRIAVWNGAFWAPLTFAPVPGLTNGFVQAIEFFDDGTGPAIYVGGVLNTVEGVFLNLIGRFDAAGWHTVGPGLMGAFEGQVRKIRALDLGTGPALYVCGNFNGTPFVMIENLAKWQNGQWTSPIIQSVPVAPVLHDLTALDQGSGPRLAVFGGMIQNPGFIHGAAVWDGASWSPLIPGGLLANNPNTLGLGTARAFAEFDDGRGSSLFLGGEFDATGLAAFPAHGIGRYGPSTPLLGIRQPAPGLPGVVQNGGLIVGNEYFNLFSLETCGGPLGSGPYFGLCATELTFLLSQAFSPVGAHPFHFIATTASMEFGPYSISPGIQLEGVAIDVTYYTPSCISPVIGYQTL